MVKRDKREDEIIIFGKHITTKRKVAWYGDSQYLYTYSNITKQALVWTKELKLESLGILRKTTSEQY